MIDNAEIAPRMKGLPMSLPVVLTIYFPAFISPLWRLTSGFVVLVVNLTICVACAYMFPQTAEEKSRVETCSG